MIKRRREGEMIKRRRGDNEKDGERGVRVKKRVWGNTGGRFRSYVLWGVIHNHPQVVPKLRGRKEEDGV